MAPEPTLSLFAQLAAASALTHTVSSAASGESGKTKEQVRRHYIRTLHRVVDEPDVVLLVLDARDPAGCRSRLLEEEVRRREAEGKRLVFVLNKIGARALRLVYIPLLLSICRLGAAGECTRLAQASPSYDPDAALPLRGLSSAHEPLFWHWAGAPSPA